MPATRVSQQAAARTGRDWRRDSAESKPCSGSAREVPAARARSDRGGQDVCQRHPASEGVRATIDRIDEHTSSVEVCQDVRGNGDRPAETVQPRDHQGGELASCSVSEQSCQLRAIASLIAVSASDIKSEPTRQLVGY